MVPIAKYCKHFWAAVINVAAEYMWFVSMISQHGLYFFTTGWEWTSNRNISFAVFHPATDCESVSLFLNSVILFRSREGRFWLSEILLIFWEEVCKKYLCSCSLCNRMCHFLNFVNKTSLMQFVRYLLYPSQLTRVQ